MGGDEQHDEAGSHRAAPGIAGQPAYGPEQHALEFTEDLF
jgi:hypothetical protein